MSSFFFKFQIGNFKIFCYDETMKNIILTDDNEYNLKLFEELLKEDASTIVNRALEEFFVAEQKRILEQDMANENAMTNLSYDEFWDDIDLD